MALSPLSFSTELEITRIGTALRDILFTQPSLARVFDLVDFLLRSLSDESRASRSGALRALAALLTDPPEGASLDAHLFAIASGAVAVRRACWFELLHAKRRTRFSAIHNVVLDRALAALDVETDLELAEALATFWAALRADKNKNAPPFRLGRSLFPRLLKRWHRTKDQLSKRPAFVALLCQIFLQVLSSPDPAKLCKGSESDAVMIYSRGRISSWKAPTTVAQLAAKVCFLELADPLVQSQDELIEVLVGAPLAAFRVAQPKEWLPYAENAAGDQAGLLDFAGVDAVAALSSANERLALLAMGTLLLRAETVESLLTLGKFRSRRALEVLLGSLGPSPSAKCRIALFRLWKQFPDVPLLAQRCSEMEPLEEVHPIDLPKRSLLAEARVDSVSFPEILPLLVGALHEHGPGIGARKRLYSHVLDVVPLDVQRYSHILCLMERLAADPMPPVQASSFVSILFSVTLRMLGTVDFPQAISGSTTSWSTYSCVCSLLANRFPENLDVLQVCRDIAAATSTGTLSRETQGSPVARWKKILSSNAEPEHSILQPAFMLQSHELAFYQAYVIRASAVAVATDRQLRGELKQLQSSMLRAISLVSPVDHIVLARSLLHPAFFISQETAADFVASEFFGAKAQYPGFLTALATACEGVERTLPAKILSRLLKASVEDLNVYSTLDFAQRMIFSSLAPDDFVSEGSFRLLPPPDYAFEPEEAAKLAEIVHHSAVRNEELLHPWLLMLLAVGKQREANAQAMLSVLATAVSARDENASKWLQKQGGHELSWWPLGLGMFLFFFSGVGELAAPLLNLAASLDSIAPNKISFMLLCCLYALFPMEGAAVVPEALARQVERAEHVQEFGIDLLPSPLVRSFHWLLVKLEQKADISDLAYLTLRKLCYLHPSVAERTIVPSLVQMIVGRSESLRQQHIQHKQRWNSGKVVAGLFEDFMVVRQDHRLYLYVLGLLSWLLANGATLPRIEGRFSLYPFASTRAPNSNSL